MNRDLRDYINEITQKLSKFCPTLPRTPSQQQLFEAISSITKQNVNTYADVAYTYEQWEKYVIELIGADVFNGIVNDDELFINPERVDLDLNIATTKELIKKYGTLSTFNFSQNPQEIALNKRRYNALSAEMKTQILRTRMQNLSEEEALEGNQDMQEQSELETQIADNERSINKLEQELTALRNERIDNKRWLETSLQTATTDRDRILDNPIFQKWQERYNHYRNTLHLTRAQIRYHMRSLTTEQFETFERNIQELRFLNAQITNLQQRINRANWVHESMSLLAQRLNVLYANNERLKTRLNIMRNAINVESQHRAPIIEQLQQIQPNVQQARQTARENYVNQLRIGRAHNQDERNQIQQQAQAQNLAMQPIETIEKYFNNYPINMNKINETIVAVKQFQRVDVANFSNDERSILKPKLIEAIEDTFKNINANVSTRVIIGRNGEHNAPASMNFNTKDDVINFLKDWTENGILIQYDDETHYQLTDGDRNFTAPFWTVDWFQIVVNNGAAAPGGGFPKFYFNKTGKEDDDEISAFLKRYQIPDKNSIADLNADMLEPCLIHVILQLDFWTERQRQMVKNLLFSRVRFIHVSAADAHIIFQELNVNAIIKDRDNGKTLEYFSDGKRYEIINDNVAGVKKFKGCVNKREKYFGKVQERKRIPTLHLNIYKQHYFLDEPTKYGVDSYTLIKKLEDEGRILPLSKFDTSIYYRQLKVNNLGFNVAAYFSSCWKTIDEMLQQRQHCGEIQCINLDDIKTLKEYKSNENNGIIGFKLILNYIKEHNLNILADGGTVKNFLSQSTRGAIVAVENNTPVIVNEEITSLDMNSCYWFALQNINVGAGLPNSIPQKWTYDDIMQIVRNGGIIFVKCEYNYKPQHALDVNNNNKKKLVLTNYDLLNDSYVINKDATFSGFYWLGDKVLKKPFYELVDKLYYYRKHVNNELKHVLNAGIGMLIHKYKPRYYKPKNSERIPSNINYYGEINGKEVWINPLDYEYNFTQIHSLIISYVQLYLQNIFITCKNRGVRMIYTSTDSLVIPSAHVQKVSEFINENKLGLFKIEAKSKGGVFLGRGLYYINSQKYGTLNIPHDCLEAHCKKNNLTLLEFYKELARKGGNLPRSIYSLFTEYSKTMLLS